MKHVKELAFYENICEVREFDFGVFYYFDGIVISEIKEGVSFCYEMAEKAIAAADEILDPEKPIAYISNRVYSYSIVPTDWLKFYSNRRKLDFYCVVGVNHSSVASIVLERMFFHNSIRQFSNIQDAIDWSLFKISELQETA